MSKLDKTTPLIPATDLEAFMDEYVSKLEERVAVEVRNFQVLADAMPQIVWTTLPDGTADYYNKRWYEYSGYTEEETFSYSGWKSIKGIMHPDDRELVIEKWQYSLETSEPFEAEFRLKDQKGGYRWFLGRAVPGYDSKGKLAKWYGTSTDIDDHKRAQEQKDEFIAIASHELKTPVTSIKIFTQMLYKYVQEQGDDKLEDKLEKMDTQVDKLTVLINDLLDVTKIDTGRLELRQDVFNVDDFISEAVKGQQLINETHRITVKGKAQATLYADKDRIEQVLINFISNAVKYSPDSDEIVLHVSTKNNEVVIGVQDYGIGIADNEQKNVFERFFRVRGPQYETFPGMGLGLYIASEIINRENGRIWLESKFKHGSTFYFSLPIREQHKA